MNVRANARSGAALGTVALLSAACMSLASGCESAEAKRCRAEYLATHAMVPSIDVDDFASVQQGLGSVEATTTSCQAAGLKEELEQLEKVKNQLQSHLDYLRTHGKPKDLSPDELARLIEQGDPNCPKGQAYKPKRSDEQIRCTGPKLADMNFSQVTEFFGRRGYRLHVEGTKVKAEYGSESYTYHFASEDDPKPARCIHVFAPPGIAWQESLARLTGTPPHRLKRGQPVKTSRGDLPLSHTEDATQAIYQLGHCAS